MEKKSVGCVTFPILPMRVGKPKKDGAEMKRIGEVERAEEYITKAIQTKRAFCAEKNTGWTGLMPCQGVQIATVFGGTRPNSQDVALG